jgi:ketosteroid isomerase-like protein
MHAHRQFQTEMDGQIQRYCESCKIDIIYDVVQITVFGDPMITNSETVVREFWRLMATNDFASVKTILSPHFILEWPQSNERIRGAENFARMNAEYPTTTGQWSFKVNHLVAQATTVVTQVSVTDGEQIAEAISFFTLEDGKITYILEYWPEPYTAPINRRHLTEPIV